MKKIILALLLALAVCGTGMGATGYKVIDGTPDGIFYLTDAAGRPVNYFFVPRYITVGMVHVGGSNLARPNGTIIFTPTKILVETSDAADDDSVPIKKFPVSWKDGPAPTYTDKIIIRPDAHGCFQIAYPGGVRSEKWLPPVKIAAGKSHTIIGMEVRVEYFMSGVKV